MKKHEIRVTMGVKKTGDIIIDTIYEVLKRTIPSLKISQEVKE